MINMSTDFYATIPSNASIDVFPDNSQGSFTTKLQNPINLSEYEAGLVDIQYPTTWLTLKNSHFKVTINGTTYKADMLDAKYLDFDRLIQALNNLLRNYHIRDRILIHYDQHTMYATVQVKTAEVKIQFDKVLGNVLGFDPDTVLELGTHKGSHPADLDSGMTSLYVYSDIVTNQIVGDTVAPLLRTVPLRRNNSDTFSSEEFRHVRYLPLVGSVTNLIQIVIRRDTGEDVPFTTGKVIVTLHFRKLQK